MRCTSFALLGVVAATMTVFAQTPRPFPTPRSGNPPPVAPEPAAPPATGQTLNAKAPTEATLGVPIYPSVQFLTSYDAGRGQRYYLFGTQAGFTEIVTYYKTILKQKGEVVYDQPPTHTFEVGKSRAEAMAFPPGVTVKDFSFDGSEGYVNPRPGARPKYFPTIIQIVPVPAIAVR